MKSIQKYLPYPRHTEVMRIFVNASAEAAWQSARNFNVSSIPWINTLFRMRTFADVFTNEKPIFGDTHKGFIDEIAEHGQGFAVLEEVPGQEVVVGAIGKFWHLNIPFANVPPAKFASFKENGWAKVAWSIRIEPFHDGSTISFELRTTATDDSSWKKLNLYYHLIGTFSKLIRHSVMFSLEKDLGKMRYPDTNTPVAGDDIILHTNFQDTDSIIIEAPASIVWSYLMQLGCDRAGWYSIDLFDNANRKSTDHIESSWGERKTGDKIPMSPSQVAFFDVLGIEHEKHFVLGSEARDRDKYFRSTWAFQLDPIGEYATHLIVRVRMTMLPRWKEWVLGNIVYLSVHGLMEAVQLQTIKKYAERDARALFPEVA